MMILIAIPLILILACALLFSAMGNAASGAASLIAQLTGPVYLIVGLLAGSALGFIGGAVWHTVRVERKHTTGLPVTPPTQQETLPPGVVYPIQQPTQQQVPIDVDLSEWGF